jgi:hypothetical protein
MNGSVPQILVFGHSFVRRFFRFPTYFIQMQIIKLRETILPSVGISSLNDFYSKNKEDDWFYDEVIPKGFDGRARYLLEEKNGADNLHKSTS